VGFNELKLIVWIVATEAHGAPYSVLEGHRQRRPHADGESHVGPCRNESRTRDIFP
jgi:hypothetical protein